MKVSVRQCKISLVLLFESDLPFSGLRLISHYGTSLIRELVCIAIVIYIPDFDSTYMCSITDRK